MVSVAKILSEKLGIFGRSSYLCTQKVISLQNKMEQRKFKNRLEEVRWINQQKGWKPLTEEEKTELNDLVRTFTNLN